MIDSLYNVALSDLKGEKKKTNRVEIKCLLILCRHKQTFGNKVKIVTESMNRDGEEIKKKVRIGRTYHSRCESTAKTSIKHFGPLPILYLSPSRQSNKEFSFLDLSSYLFRKIPS